MNRLTFFTKIVFSLLITSPSLASIKEKKSVALRDSQIRFEFASQDGDLLYNCTHELIPSLMDYEVICAREKAPEDKFKFVVHARLFIHERPEAPKLSYELLYWVTDRQLTGGKLGQFTGTTLWFNLQENVPLMSLTAGQDIQNNYVLTMFINLIESTH